MPDYRNYGKTVNPTTGAIIDGASRVPINSVRRTQVYEATHKEKIIYPI